MIGKVSLIYVCVLYLACFATVTKAANTFTTHTSADCSEASAIGMVQSPCIRLSFDEELWYAVVECTGEFEAPTTAVPAGWQYVKYTEAKACDFSGNWTLVAVNKTDISNDLYQWYYNHGTAKINATVSCANGNLGASVCETKGDVCYSFSNMANNQCADITVSGMAGYYSALQTSCAAPVAPVAPTAPTATPTAAPTTSKTPTKANSASSAAISGIALVASTMLLI